MSNPVVTNVSPAPNAADIVLGSPITVTFSEPINTDTLNNATFVLTGPSAIEIVTPLQLIEKNPEPARGRSYILGLFTFSTVTFSPWSPFTAYHVGNQIVDSNGNAQTCIESGTSAPYAPAWLTTQGAATVDNNIPAWQSLNEYTFGQYILDPNGNLQKCTTSVGGTSGVKSPSWNTILSGVTFDGGISWTNYGALNPIIWSNGGRANSGVTIATFTPSCALTPGTVYTVLIVGTDSTLATTYVEDVSGNPMLTSYQWSFTTGTLNIVVPPIQNPILPSKVFIDPQSIKVVPRATLNEDISIIELIFPQPINPDSFDPTQLLIGIGAIMDDPQVQIPGQASASYTIQGNKLIVTVTGLASGYHGYYNG